ncbi:MAG TPA: hypothetical protein VK988_10645 [Acidimicrobiales bacterium]|nr:hypothetical protein [Acidimicrobiales bacterium]
MLYQLYRHGLLASLAPSGTPVVDVLLLASDQSVVATVQVKTRTYGADGGWHMSEKHERIVEPRCFYAFVKPRARVPCHLRGPERGRRRRAWYRPPGLPGHARSRRTSAPRSHHARILPSYSFEVAGYPPGWLDRYRDRWDLLGGAIDPSDA